MQRYSALDFAQRLGGRPEDWGLQPQWTVTVDENMRVTVDELGGKALGHVNTQERALLEQRNAMGMRFSGEQIERRLGPAAVRAMGISPGDTVVIDASDRVLVGGRPVGQIHPDDRQVLEAPLRALAAINRYRASIGQGPLDPAASAWENEDVYLEAHRVARLQNPRSWRAPALAGFLGRGLGSVIGLYAGSVATVATPEKETERGRSIGTYAGGTIGAIAGAFALAPSGRRWHAALGALTANAAALVALPFTSWWVSNGIGAVLTPIAIYFAARPPALSSRATNPIAPSTKRWIWIGGAVGVALLVGGVAYAKIKKKGAPSEPLAPAAAVDRAIQILGTDADADDVANAAYPMAYPDCPDVLDPDDPAHTECIDAWIELRALAVAALPDKRRKPPKREGAPPEPLSTEGPAADMRTWLDGLTQHQRSELRRILGSTYYDPIKNAAQAGDDGKTVSSVLRLKRSIETLVSEDPFKAAAQYSELKKLLGPKLDELLGMAEKYQ